MNKFLRLLLSLSLLVCTTKSALADLVVIIDGKPLDITGQPAAALTTPPPPFTRTAPPTPGNSVVDLLTCPVLHPCAYLYPSGTIVQGDPADLVNGSKPNAANDSLMIQDACGRPPFPDCITLGVDRAARIEKSDGEVDKVQVKGLEITSLDDTPKTVTINVDTGEDNFAAPSGSGSRSFPVTLYFGGYVTDAQLETPGPIAGTLAKPSTSCSFKNPAIGLIGSPKTCPQSQLTVTTNGQAHSKLLNVSMPCNERTNAAEAVINPCYDTDRYSVTGAFSSSRTDAITCEGPCAPQHQALVSTTFAKKGQSLVLLNSGVAAMSRLEVEKFGVEALYHAIADEFDEPFWVGFTAVDERYQAQLTDVSNSGDQVLLTFDLQKTGVTKLQDPNNFDPTLPAKPTQFVLNSIATPKDGIGSDAILPVLERARNERSYATFIAKPRDLRWRDVTRLQMDYDFTVGQQSSFDPRLDSQDSGPPFFSPCAGDSLYVRVALTKEGGKDAGKLLIRLGGNDQDQCADSAMSGNDIIGEGGARVDDSKLGGDGCCMSVTESQMKYGDLFVRSISLVVDQSSKQNANFQVLLRQGQVERQGGAKPFMLTDTLTVLDPTGWLPFTDLPQTGRSIQISREDQLPSKPILIIPNDKIINKGAKMLGGFSIKKLLSKDLPHGTPLRADLCLFGGRCIPGQGHFTLP